MAAVRRARTRGCFRQTLGWAEQSTRSISHNLPHHVRTSRLNIRGLLGGYERERMRRGQPKKVLPVGKLPREHLRSLLRHLPKHDPRLLVGPQIGEDAAVIDAGDRYLVVTTDPITFATDHIGRYAVHVNANDIAVLGARPLWFFVVMLLPESRTTLNWPRRSWPMCGPRARNWASRSTAGTRKSPKASTARFWSARCSARSAIWLRAELPVQRNRTFGFDDFMLLLPQLGNRGDPDHIP